MERRSRSIPRGSAPALAIAIVFSSGEAVGSTGEVSLDRNPVLFSKAMPDELVCEFDEDDNGLDDEIETQIAQALVPQFRFDKSEEHTRSGEPRAVFNTRMSLDGSGRRILTIKYVFVWDRDGGFVNSDICGDAHAGDTQPMTVTAEVYEGTDRWFARLSKLDGFTQQEALGPDELLFDGSHPLVFPTAGKHHFRPYPNQYTYNGEVNCHENAYGNGPVRNPIVEHVPHGTRSGNLPLDYVYQFAEESACKSLQNQVYQVCVDDPSGLMPSMVVECGSDATEVNIQFEALPWHQCTDYPNWVEVGGRRRWTNACTKRRTGKDVAAVRSLRPLDLTDWGHPINGHSPSFLTKFFLSYDVSGVYMDSPNTADDVDGDGVKRWDDVCPMTKSGASWSQLDQDSDGIGDECDPAPAFQSVYVAGGSNGYPAAASAVTYAQDFHSWRAIDRPGYLDSDNDGRPDGEDLCPYRPGSGGDTDRNNWGERMSWAPLESVSPSVRNNQLGTFYRGDSCDPYPHARPIWVTGSQAARWPFSSRCKQPGWRARGASEVRIAHQAGRGISSNDTSASFGDPPRPFWTQTFRCACSTFEGDECLENSQSLCFRNNVEPAAEHTALYRGRGWRAIDYPGCAEGNRDLFGYCGPYPLPIPYADAFQPISQPTSVGNTSEILWTWRSELDRDQTGPTGDLHFASGDFTYESPTDSPFLKHDGRYASKYQYVLWTWVGADQGYKAPGPLAKKYLADPEELDARLIPHEGANVSERSRRLRSGHDESLHSLVSSYDYFDPVDVPCPAWTAEDIEKLHTVNWGYEYIHCWPRPDERVRTPSDMLFVERGRRLNESYLVLGDAQRLVSIRLAPEVDDGLEPGWTVPVANTSCALHSDALLDAAAEDLAGMPHLMRLEQRADAAHWTLLRPVAFDGRTVSYAPRAEGDLPTVLTDRSRLVQDELGTFVALIVPEDGIWGFEPKLERWISADVPNSAWPVLPRANAVLVGSSLFLTQGNANAVWEGDTWEGDTWHIDLFGREAKSLSLGLPARTDARLALSTDRSTLILSGGVDTEGVVHDDVWSVALPRGGGDSDGRGAWPRARRVRPDSGRASRIPESTIVASDADGRNVRAWSFDAEAGVGTISRLTRTDRGWLQLDDDGVAALETCPDLQGGQLCKVEPSWWASPGDRACADPPETGACEGTTGELVWETTLHVGGNLVDAVNDGTSVWLLTRRELIRKRFNQEGQPVELARLSLPERGLSLAVSDGQVLVGLQDGVHSVEQRGNELVLGEGAALCGRPLRIAPLEGPRWAINTTLGTVLVNTGRPGAPTIESAVMVLPGPGGSGQTFDLPETDPEIGSCRIADRSLGALEMLADISAIVGAGRDRLLVARGPHVVELDVSDAATPVATGSVYVGTGLRWLRVDEAGGRAYGWGLGPAPQRSPVLDLRNGRLELRGQHDVSAWVSRQDAGRLSVTVQTGNVRIAEVLR